MVTSTGTCNLAACLAWSSPLQTHDSLNNMYMLEWATALQLLKLLATNFNTQTLWIQIQPTWTSRGQRDYFPGKNKQCMAWDLKAWWRSDSFPTEHLSLIMPPVGIVAKFWIWLQVLHWSTWLLSDCAAVVQWDSVVGLLFIWKYFVPVFKTICQPGA